MTRKRIKTTKQEIATYWKDELEANQTNVTYKQATSHCWRCGVKKRLDRCHILPESLGGEDTPNNFVLLCKHCHFDNPNIDNVDIIWDWLRAYRHQETSFWFAQGKREYEYIYGESLESTLHKESIDSEVFQEAFDAMIQTVGHHFGQPRNNRATVAGAIRLTINELKKRESHEKE